MNAVRLYLYILAYKLTAIGNAVVLLYLWPVFALLIESALEKKKLSAAKLGVLFLATGGVIAMNIDKRFSLSGSDVAGESLHDRLGSDFRLEHDHLQRRAGPRSTRSTRCISRTA